MQRWTVEWPRQGLTEQRLTFVKLFLFLFIYLFIWYDEILNKKKKKKEYTSDTSESQFTNWRCR